MIAASDNETVDIEPREMGQWLNVVEAAAALRCHRRTIERRVEAGRLESRRNGGRTEVWVPGIVSVDAPDVQHAHAVSGTVLPAIRQTTEQQLEMAMSAAERAQQDAGHDVEQARRSARHAWVVVLTLLAVSVAGAGIGTWAATKAVAEAQKRTHWMAAQADALADRTEQLANDLQRERERVEQERTRADAMAERLLTARSQAALATAELQYAGDHLTGAATSRQAARTSGRVRRPE